MTDVRTTTSIHPRTVTGVSTGETPAVRSRAARRKGGVWVNQPETREQIPDRLLASALTSAGGDANRLWFGLDGAVWILNHGRMTSCTSPACPACQGGKRRTSRDA